MKKKQQLQLIGGVYDSVQKPKPPIKMTFKTKRQRIIIFKRQLLASQGKRAFNYKTILLIQKSPRMIHMLLMKILKILGINCELVQ